MDRKIEIENVGPITSLTLPVPENGGVVVLRGQNGCGKTHALEAIQAAVSGKGNLSCKDGELRGEVRAFGATVTVAKSTRRRGEVEVISLDGPGDIATLVDPGLKSDDAADARRVKALLTITGAKVTADTFWPVLGNREAFEEIVSPRATQGDDPVEIAERVKRDIETKALAYESQRDHHQSRASALLSQNDGIDLEADFDHSDLAEAFANARAEVTRREHEAKAYKEATERRAVAQQKITQLPVFPVTLEQLKVSRDNYSRRADKVHAKVESARKALEEAMAELLTSDRELEVAQNEVDLRMKDERIRAELESQASAELPPKVTAMDVEKAKIVAGEAQEAMERGAVIRQALSRRESANDELAAAGEYTRKALSLRNAARACVETLSGLVSKANSRLRIEAGRVVLDTQRGKTYFSELSAGEKWRIALDVAIDALGRGGILVCPQEAWEGINPKNRQMIIDHLTGTGVVMFAAEATDDEQPWAAIEGAATPEGSAAQ